MHSNRASRLLAHEQVLSDRVIKLGVRGSLNHHFEGSLVTPVSSVSGVHETLPPCGPFDHSVDHQAGHRGDVSCQTTLVSASQVQGVQVPEVSGGKSITYEECILDAFPSSPSLLSDQEGDDAQGALGTSVKDEPSPIPFDTTRFDKHGLTSSQQEFAEKVQDWCRAPRKLLLVVSGGPGAGKTYCIKEILKHIQGPQLRMSFTAVSAEAIQGRTIHSTLNLDWGPKSLCSTLEALLKNETDLQQCIEQSADIVKEFTFHGYPQVVVVDEVSMINGWLMYWLVRFFMDRTDEPLLFVAMGDRHQLNPVKSIHNLFSMTSWGDIQVHNIVLKDSKRFTPEYALLINQLRRFVDQNETKGFFQWVRTHFPVQESIDGHLLSKANRAMAYRNDRVKKFNQYYITHMVKGHEMKLNQGDLVLKPDCLVFVTKNGYSSAKNGTLLVFKKYNVALKRLICTYPESNKTVMISQDEHGKFPVDLGFASTVHKFQGSTLNEATIVIHFDNNLDVNMAYTALSRVRDKKQILAIAGLPEEEEEEEREEDTLLLEIFG